MICSEKALYFMVWGNAFLNLVDNLCSLVRIFGFEIISLCLRSFIYHELLRLALQSRKSPTVMMLLSQGSKELTYFEIRRMPSRDFTAYHITEMDCRSLALSFKHCFSRPGRHDM